MVFEGMANAFHEGLRMQRHLLEVSPTNCTPRSMDQFPSGIFTDEQRKNGFIVIHIITALYMFAMLAVVCHEYFVPSLERITKALGVESNVAGATIMAAGGSVPQLATSVIGVFIVQSDIGVGAVVGSSFFNILFVLGMCGLFAGSVIYLHWWPMFRDCTAYVISTILVTIVMLDEAVYWYESLILILVYVLYIVVLIFNQPVYACINGMWLAVYSRIDACVCVCAQRPCCCPRSEKGKADGETTTLVPEIGLTDSKEKSYHTQDGQDTGTEATEGAKEGDEHTDAQPEADEPPSVKSKGDKEYHSILTPPSNKCKLVLWVFLLPVILVVFVLVPDSRRPGCCQRLYPLTFIMSIVMLGLSSYVLVWMMTIIGDTAGVPDTVMGLTVLAAGSSLPDLLNAVFVARDGYGDMAMSNCIGSNIFDILFCLGVPWLLDSSVAQPGVPVPIYENLTYVTVCLLTSAFVVYFSTLLNGWKLDKKLGCILVLAYVLYIVFDAMYDVHIAQPVC